jgi:hypothetical protein
MTHCHGSDSENSPRGAGLALHMHICDWHICDNHLSDNHLDGCSHDNRVDEDQPWHVHWVCIHFTDDIASISCQPQIDVVSNVTTLELASGQDLSSIRNFRAEPGIWLSPLERFSIGLFKRELAFNVSIDDRYTKSKASYCSNSSRLLL